MAVSTVLKDHKSWENRDINIIHSLTERGWFKDHKSWENRDINIIHSLTERGWFKDHKSCENRDINIIHSLTERGGLYRQDLKTINHVKIEISISFIHLMQFRDPWIRHKQMTFNYS